MSTEQDELIARAEALCEARGQRLTPGRRLVFEVIARSPGPISAYQILARLLDRGRESGPPTVYRALDFLARQQLIHRIESLNAFVACRSPDRHHDCQFLICTRCGSADELEAREVVRGMEELATRTGFAVSNAILELLGTCLGCRIGTEREAAPR